MSNAYLAEIVDRIHRVIPKAPEGKTVALHEPLFQGQEWAYTKECLDTGWVSSVGKFVDQFEEKLAAYTGATRAVAVVNGTLALHLCLNIAGVTRDDEVLIPALTFVATANAVAYCGATPHFVDSEFKTLGIDPMKLDEYLSAITEVRNNGCYNKKTGKRIRALVPMHTFGHPVDLDPVMKVCEKFKLVMVEDAAESLGSFYKGRHTGNFGMVSTLSFNGNKTITTGGGGAILTNDATIGNQAKHLTTTAKKPHKWEYNHDQIGFNYRMPNLNAALGCAQMELLPKFLKWKRALAEQYKKAFAGMNEVDFFVEPFSGKEGSSNYWLNAILLKEKFKDKRNEVLELTNAKGIMTRPAWTTMHKLPMFKDYPRMDLSNAESIEERLINIPSSAMLGEKHS